MDFEDKGDVVVGAMATDENNLILVTGDCKGHIKVRRNWLETEGPAPAELPAARAWSLLPLGTSVLCNTVGSERPLLLWRAQEMSEDAVPKCSPSSLVSSYTALTPQLCVSL